LVDQWAINNSTQSVCQMGAFHNLLEEDVVFLRNILPRAFQISRGGCTQSSSPTKRKSGGAATIGGGSEYVNASFWRILSFLCKPKPVVLFLDDIHWADQASLDAIQVLSTNGQVEGLLVVVAYRDEEVPQGSVVSKCLGFIHENGGNSVHDIHVNDLDLNSVNQIVSSLLRQDMERTLELAEVVHSKTLGNPFFLIQFLQMLRQDRFLMYSLMSLKWEWGDVERIKGISDNVADIVASTMQKLPLPTQLALKACACLGKVVPLEVMVNFFETMKFDPDCRPMLCEGLYSIQMTGLKVILDEAVNFGIMIRSEDGEIYTWSHDKLQQCAYAMIPDEFKPKVHGNFGQVLWKMSASHPDDEWMLFMAADQVNRSSLDGDERFAEEVARLSYEAAKLSMYKSAFVPAFEMIQGAAKRLESLKNPWKKSYALTLSVYSGLSEVGVRLGKYEDVEDAVEKVLKNARTLEDKFRAQEVLVRLRVSGTDRDYLEGFQLVQDILLDYGVNFPDMLLPGQQFIETRKLKSRLGGDLEGLLKLRILDDDVEDDRRHHHIIRMLNALSYFAYMSRTKIQLGFYACTRALNTSIKHGICAETAMSISNLAMWMITEEGNAKEAIEYANFAKKMVDSFPQEIGSPHSRVYAAVTAGVMSSVTPFNNTLNSWLEINKIGLKIGDTERASMGPIGYTYTYFCVGLSLEPLDRDVLAFTKESQQFGMPETVKILFPILHQAIKNLTTDVSDPTLLKGEAFDEEKDIQRFTGAGHAMTKRDIDSFKLMLACIFQKWDVAAELVDALEPDLDTDKFVVRQHHRLTYMGIASIVLGQKSEKRKSHFRQLGKKIIKLFKEQIKNGSQNALPVVLMLEAIESPSKERFDEAIRATARLGLRQHQAVLYEQAAHYFLEAGDEGWGEHYMSLACNLYSDWGATAKTEALRREHWNLLKKSSITSSVGSSLQGRSRYTSEYVKQLHEVDWSSSTSILQNSSSDLLAKSEHSER
jgi:hypothetical protein